MAKTDQEKAFKRFLIDHDLRVSDFYDLIRLAGVTLGNSAARSVLNGKVKSVVNRNGTEYNFGSLIEAATRGLRGRPKITTQRDKGIRICRFKGASTTGNTRYGIIPRENIKGVVDALLKGNTRLYSIVVRDAEILYCGKPATE